MISETLLEAFAPTGVLRASINLGNPVLAHRDPASGEPGGVSVDLARELARRLGVGIALSAFDTAAQSVHAVTTEQADVGFFAIDPKRGEGVTFTAPYVLIEGCYLVRLDSPITHNDEVDRAGNRIVVGEGSAYDLFLTREIKHAQLIRAASSAAVIRAFLDQHLEVAAGVKQQLQADIAHLSGVRLLDGRFMEIRQAMGMPNTRGAAAAHYLRDFVEAMKQSGFVEQALARHGIEGASVAPLASGMQ